MTAARLRYLAALMPATTYLMIFFVIPIGAVLGLSVQGEPAWANYARIFSVPVYRIVLLNTVWTAVNATLIVLALAYPLAYLLSTLSGRLATVLLGVVALPWLTSVLVRSYAWIVILGQQGIVNRTLAALGLIAHPVSLLYSATGVYLATVHILLPYMVLTLLPVMRAIDRSLLRAAAAAGAPPWRAFLTVYLPLSLPGVAAGGTLVFVIAAGFYITPALLGGPRQMFIAQLITSEMLESLNWGLGAALATILIFVTLGGIALAGRVGKFGQLPGGAR